MIEKIFSYAQNALLQALLNVDIKYGYLYSESKGISFGDMTVNETVTFKFKSTYIVEPAADIIRDFISDYEYENQDIKMTVLRVDDKTNTITVRFTTDTVDYSVEEF